MSRIVDAHRSSAVEVWRRYDAIESRLSAALSERMLDLAGISPGQRVLDLASGRGEPALRAARRVGATGEVLGVDVAEGLLRMARDLAMRESLPQLTFRVGDAEQLIDVPTGGFDAATCRWGLMYFSAPRSALAGIHRALVPGGLAVFAVWAEPERVPYFSLPRRLLTRYRPIAPIDFQAPGTFRFAQPGALERELQGAGFAVEQVEEMEVAVMESRSSSDVKVWVYACGIARLLPDASPEDRAAYDSDLSSALEALRVDGRVRLGGVTRVVRARAVPLPLR